MKLSRNEDLLASDDDTADATSRRSRRPSMRDVAQLAGVGVSSASRALSDHPDVSPKMRRRVLAAAAQLGYEPDFLAQSLRRGATFTAGFVARDISSPLLAEIALGAEKSLRAAGYSMLVLNSEAAPALDAAHIRLLQRRRVDGLLISLSDEGAPEVLAALQALSAPIVFIDREVFPPVGASAVLVDHAAAIRETVTYLAELGHRAIGLVAGPMEVRPGREAVRAFHACCGAAGVEPVSESGPFLAEHGRQAAERMLRAAARPTALISGSNQILPGVVMAIREQGLRIPEDVSLVTFDDLPLLNLLEPAVDVIRRGAFGFGQLAAELLIEQLQGGEARSVLVPTTFERRGSSAPPQP